MTTICEIIKILSYFYYSSLILLLIETFTVLYGIRNYNKIGNLKIFLWYLILDTTLFISSLLLDASKLLSPKELNKLDETINASISLVEIIIYFTYFRNQINAQKYFYRHLLLIAPIIFLIISIDIFNGTPTNLSYFSGTHFLSAIAFLLIFPLGINYIKSIFNSESDRNIYQDPGFWISVGILYYSGVSTPYYYFRGFFKLETEVLMQFDTALFYTPFILNIICILISFICKKRANS